MAQPAKPTPVFTTDADGNRVGDRPTVGPASAEQIHAALKSQDALAKSPRPAPAVAEDTVGATPAANPTKNLSVANAANTLANRGHVIETAIDDASQ